MNYKGLIYLWSCGIHHRPIEAYTKEEIGHWEGDTIWWKNRKGGILTFTERASWFELAAILKKKLQTM